MRAAFTLVEVLVALAIVAVIGGAVASLQVANARAARAATALHGAVSLARGELALQRAVAEPPSVGCMAGGLATPFQPADCMVERVCLSPPPRCDLVSVTVRIAREPAGEVVLRTVVSAHLEGRR